MRLSIRHATHYNYEEPGDRVVQRIRLTPRDLPSQQVVRWAIEAPGIEQAPSYVDGFGNRTHLVATRQTTVEAEIVATGEVETTGTDGVLGKIDEAVSPSLFLRATPMTEGSGAINDLARKVKNRNTLEGLHWLMRMVAERVVYETGATDAATTAAEAFTAGRGVCQDHAHIFIAAARQFAVPARYVTGYLRVEGAPESVAHHAWAEAHVDDLGWVGFDPANGISPTEDYVRLTCGFDAPSAAPIVGVRRGSSGERLSVDVRVEQQQQ